MAKKRGVRITIIVEDEALERFSREVLLKFGFSRHELRVVPYPVGEGSAKTWVDRQYPIEVQTLRSKLYQQLGIVVGTDADQLAVTHRFDRLAESLKSAGVQPRGEGERIVIWVPKWNVETWILYFSGDERDEDQNYRHDVKRVDFSAVAEGLINEFRAFSRDNTMATLPSLGIAYEETKRLGV